MDIYEFPNQKGKMPMGNVTWTEAKSLCETEGKRLCSSAEWGRACRGLEKRTVSYGEQYDRNKCNTAINGSGPGVGQPAPIKPSGIFPDCKSPEEYMTQWIALRMGFDPWSDFAEPFNPTPNPIQRLGEPRRNHVVPDLLWSRLHFAWAPWRNMEECR